MGRPRSSGVFMGEGLALSYPIYSGIRRKVHISRAWLVTSPSRTLWRVRQGGVRTRNSHKSLHRIYWNCILLDIYNQVENMNWYTLKIVNYLLNSPCIEGHSNLVFIMSPQIKTYCLGVHKDCWAFWTRHHHFQWTFEFGTNALQTLAKKADCLVSYVSKLSLDCLWRRA